MLETAGLPVPGETTLLLSGVAASTGRLEPLDRNRRRLGGRDHRRQHRLRRSGATAVAAWCCAWPHIGGVEGSLAWGERFFARHGGKTVFIARWLPGPAHLRRLDRRAWCTCRGSEFFLWNALGGITWCATVDRPRLLLRPLPAPDREGARRRRRDRPGRGRGRGRGDLAPLREAEAARRRQRPTRPRSCPSRAKVSRHTPARPPGLARPGRV